jgi:hypothetical protein
MFRIDIFIIPKRIRLGAAAATLQLLGCTVPGLPQRNKRAQTHDHYYNFPPCLPPLPTVGSDRHVCARCQHEGVGEQRQGRGAARSPPRETTSFGALHACCATFWLHIDDLSCTASENKQTELFYALSPARASCSRARTHNRHPRRRRHKQLSVSEPPVDQ